MKNLKNQKTIPIFFVTDENYVPFLCVSLKSIVLNASKEYNYKIHILNTGLTNKSIKNIKSVLSDNFVIEFNDIKEQIKNICDKLHTRDYYSKATYYRLFIPNMFPEYDKILYLDSDITVLGDISKLYEFEIGNNMVGAVVDEAVNSVPEFIHYVNNFLGIKESCYFNAGVLLMNLKVLRDEKFEEKFLKLLKTIKFTVAQDQDYLNVLCKDRVFYLPNVWNKMPFKNNKILTEDIKLIHYNLTLKPWHYDGILYEEVFWKYAVLTDVINDIFLIKSDFSEINKLNDFACGERLKSMAKEQADNVCTFKYLLNKGKIVV